MCTIDRMLIKGIRSFSPNNTNVIIFYKPLTLIVGSNGAGKTTIIECLKQACTGELPPNTRSGHSFVHDPKVAHETEVKALIKLRFFTGIGQRVTVLRAFQLTQKKSQLQFKTLDSTVVTRDPESGKETAMTGKCNDVDKLVPSLMGVSKAVLENVIFVHQEESNWPLAEGRVLKERFDDIFAATKYTKALETLRKLRTEKAQEIKLLQGELNTLRVQRDNAMKLQSEAAEAQEAIDQHDEQAARLQQQIKDKSVVIDQLSESLTRLRQLGHEIQMVTVRLQELQKQVAGKKAQLQGFEVQESSEEVAALLQNFDRDLDQKRLLVTRLKREIHSRRLEVASLQDQYSRAVAHQSKLTAEKEAHERALRERDVFIRDAAGQLGLREVDLSRRDGPGGCLPAQVVDHFQEGLRQHVAGSEAALQAAKEANRKRDEQLTDAVDSLTTQLTQHQEQLRMKREQKQSNERSIQSLTSQAESILVNESMSAAVQARVNDLQDLLRQKTEEQSRQDFDSKLAMQKREVDQVAALLADLRQEQDRVAAASEAATRLRLKSQELVEKREGLAAALRSRRVKLLQLLGTDELPPTDQLKARCETAAAQRRQELDTQQAALQEKQAAESHARAALQAARQALSAVETQRNQVLAQLRSRIPPAADLQLVWEAGRAVENDRLLEATLSARKVALEEAKNKLAHHESMSKYFIKIRQIMCDSHECPACFRAFNTDADLNQSLNQLDEATQTNPTRVQSLRQRVEAAQEKVDVLLSVQPLWHKLVDLEVTALREAQDAIRPREATLDGASAAAQEAAELLGLSQVEEAEARQLVAEVVFQVDMQAKEVAALQQEVSRMEASSTSQAGGVAPRSLAQLADEIETAELDRTKKETTLEFTRKKQTRMRDEILQVTRDLSEAREELNQSKAKLDKRAELRAQVADLEARNVGLLREVARQEQEAQPLEDKREEAVALRAQVRGTMQLDEERHEAALRTALQLQDSFHTKLRPIREYEGRQGAAQLTRAAAAVEEVQANITRLNQEIETKEGEERAAVRDVAEGETTRHQMQDVLQLRGLQTDLEEQEALIQQLEEQQQQLGPEPSLETKYKSGLSERSGLQGKLDMLKGARQMQQQVLARANRDLQSDQYIDIVFRYNQMFAKVMYTELANADLDKYHKALEKALLSFHTTKMADINKIIKELWQKTYRGQDIDYIQVKADAEGGQRSYNYRVVMYSGGAELEMRGRCSAGQKVLACLIIRLALAETFCLNCGILALDEPTTNLDSENAKSLAEALRAIMVARKEQENFQLIVITHDEQFAHSIGTREQAEYMWRITKDEEQHTRVDLEMIE